MTSLFPFFLPNFRHFTSFCPSLSSFTRWTSASLKRNPFRTRFYRVTATPVFPRGRLVVGVGVVLADGHWKRSRHGGRRGRPLSGDQRSFPPLGVVIRREPKKTLKSEKKPSTPTGRGAKGVECSCSDQRLAPTSRNRKTKAARHPGRFFWVLF